MAKQKDKTKSQKQNQIKSNSDKFPPCHSSPLDMRPPVCSPLLLQPLAFPQCPCPPPGCTPMCFSNLGQPSQQTARRSPCCCGWERPPVTRDDLGPLGAKSPPLGNLSVLGECISHTLPSSGQCTDTWWASGRCNGRVSLTKIYPFLRLPHLSTSC